MEIQKPLLQVALDYVDLEPAMEMAKKVVDAVDIVEAGTPLIKAVGMRSILRDLRALGEKAVVADLKAADVADIEFKVAAEYKANYVTVLGASPIENIQDGLKAAQELGLILVADLLGVENYVERAKELVGIGVEHIGLHCGISEQRQGKNIFTKTREVAEAIVPLGGKIVVAGGIKLDNIDNLKGIPGIAIIIVGGGITSASDPLVAAQSLKEKINNL